MEEGQTQPHIKRQDPRREHPKPNQERLGQRKERLGQSEERLAQGGERLKGERLEGRKPSRTYYQVHDQATDVRLGPSYGWEKKQLVYAT